MKKTLQGEFHDWNLFGTSRLFTTVTLPYSEAREFIMAVPYSAISGKGEQRAINETNIRTITSAMETGNYTPTPASASLRRNHRSHLKMEGNKFTLEVDSDDPLPQIDGGHRFESLGRILKSLKDKLASTTDEKEKKQIATSINQIESAPVAITLYFNGNPQKDFVNLQAGRSIDTSHMLSLRIQQDGTPTEKRALQIARILSKQTQSPFEKHVKFDSRGVQPLPISTLCAKGASDIGTSLIGLARIGDTSEKFTDERLAHCVVAAHMILSSEAPELLEAGKPLSTIDNGGKKGSATMMTGLGSCLAYRMIKLDHELPSRDDLAILVSAAKEALSGSVTGNFSGPVKRQLLGVFARLFFEDISDELEQKHEGIPVGLLQILSCSTFGVSSLPKVRKPRKSKKNQQEGDGVATTEQESVAVTESSDTRISVVEEDPDGGNAVELPPVLETEDDDEENLDPQLDSEDEDEVEEENEEEFGNEDAESAPWEQVLEA